MNIIDGAIFARKRSTENWQPYQLKKGPRKGTMVERNTRTGAIRDIEEDEPYQPQPSALEGFNLHDPLDRNVAADWLTDNGRQQEADFLRSPAGRTAILDGGRIMGIQDLPGGKQSSRLREEFEHLGISTGPIQFADSPILKEVQGAIRLIHEKGGMIDTRFSGEILAAARAMAAVGMKQIHEPHPRFGGPEISTSFYEAANSFRKSVLQPHDPEYGINLVAAYAHRLMNPKHEATRHIVTGDPRLAGLHPNDPNANDGLPSKVDFFSLPGANSIGGKNYRVYYFIMSRDETTRGEGQPPEKFTQTSSTPWAGSLEDSIRMAHSERPWDRRW